MASSALAAEAPLAPPTAIAGPGVGDVLYAVGMLGLLICLLLAVLWLLKRYGPRAGLGLFSRGPLALEGQLALAPGRSVAVVRCHNRRLVLGVAEGGVSLLAELDPADETEGLPQPVKGIAQRGGEKDFQHHLEKAHEHDTHES